MEKTNIPDAVLVKLNFAAGTIAEINKQIRIARNLDQKLNSSGRYEFEAWGNLNASTQFASALEAIGLATLLSLQNQVDISPILQQIKAEPPETLSNAARAWT